MMRKEIAIYRQDLRTILKIGDDNQRLEKLEKLAKEVGAGYVHTEIATTTTTKLTTGNEILIHQNPISESELVLNINNALQTETLIVNCIYARRSVYAAIAAVIVSIVSISSAMKANRISAASLQNSYIPWLQITDIEPSVLEPNEIEIKYVCKNFANGGPALNLDITITVFGRSTTNKLYGSNALMPNAQSCFSAYVDPHGMYQLKALVEKLKNGESPIAFDIYFNDIFGRKFKVHQEYKSTKEIFRMTEYKVDGI